MSRLLPFVAEACPLGGVHKQSMGWADKEADCYGESCVKCHKTWEWVRQGPSMSLQPSWDLPSAP